MKNYFISLTLAGSILFTGCGYNKIIQKPSQIEQIDDDEAREAALNYRGYLEYFEQATGAPNDSNRNDTCNIFEENVCRLSAEQIERANAYCNGIWNKKIECVKNGRK